MRSDKCKKSVFCALFFLCFIVGTICGVFAFRCFCPVIVTRNVDLMTPIFFGTSLIGEIFSLLRPLIFVLVLLWLRASCRVMWFLIFCRGFLISYYFSAVVYCGLEIATIALILKSAALLVFYLLCWQHYFVRNGFRCVR